MAKVFGSSYEIAVLIVTPNKVVFDGTKRPEPTDETALCSADGSVLVDDVKFSYPSRSDIPVLKGVTIDVQRNQVVALVGQSGCGKSSIISLIERFYDPVEGKLFF